MSHSIIHHGAIFGVMAIEILLPIISYMMVYARVKMHYAQKPDFQVKMAGHNCHWNFFLAASMGDREERTTFHINVHSVGTDYNSNFLSILVARNPSLGKPVTIDKVLVLYGSAGGDVLLMGGLYCVLWGKKREEDRKSVTTDEQNTETKEKITLECITSH
ncbi:hypothetical protein POTOM_009724 [Populus tomentosa]|uniref:Uncharacterized protein n=1 Tax=Populus tomentosa TaxID=118781 RepID=A0A8X8D1N4_POPTO|nr:hypothetical protein POTOM_009724 [Populus tomentosa]